MFSAIGKGVTKVWPLWIVLWVGAAVALWWFGPNWDLIAHGGEFSFMPENMASRKAEKLLDDAFPNRQVGSTIVVVVHRPDGKLTDADRKFVSGVVHPDLAKFSSKLGEHGKNTRHGESMVIDLLTPDDKHVGPLLVSPDEQAELLVLDLTADFMEMRSFPLIDQIETDMKGWRSSDKLPKGLELSLTGSAVLGRDMIQAEADSAARTRLWTVLLVVILLVVIYQAPLMAIVPLITLFVAVEVSLQILAICAQAGWIKVFEGLQVYITVITYGPGVDYTLFLAARYKENLQHGLDYRPALSEAVARVGAAVTASAFTVICGIGTMAFAQFGKFQEAGIAIAFSLFVVLIATLTLTPALLLLARKWAFWPFTGTVASAGTGTPLPASATPQKRFWRTIWDDIGGIIERRPGTVWLATCAVMLPLAIFGALYYNHITYGLIEELPSSAPSVVGTRALEKHFPAGTTGTTTVLIRNDKVDFSTPAGIDVVDTVVQNLYERREALEIADLRSIADPLGESKTAQKVLRAGGNELVARAHARQEAMPFYVANGDKLKNHVTRIDIVLSQDPFLLAAVTDLNKIEHAVRLALPENVAGDTEIQTLGITASVRDMDQIAASDRVQINSFVVLGVFVILLLLLWQFALSVYLMLTVLFSFLTTMGVTYGLFWAFNSSNFNGLDWTVPIFLFVVLVAIGEDYNIFLITRIHEEQEKHGEVHGITVALERTGAIITSCGFIMAGTFASLMTGSLARMLQLGFALAFGVMLDTFVVRPILVPAFLVLLAKGTFGEFGKHLVARRALTRRAQHPAT